MYTQDTVEKILGEVPIMVKVCIHKIQWRGSYNGKGMYAQDIVEKIRIFSTVSCVYIPLPL
jgi:hypothetical protein